MKALEINYDCDYSESRFNMKPNKDSFSIINKEMISDIDSIERPQNPHCKDLRFSTQSTSHPSNQSPLSDSCSKCELNSDCHTNWELSLGLSPGHDDLFDSSYTISSTKSLDSCS